MYVTIDYFQLPFGIGLPLERAYSRTCNSGAGMSHLTVALCPTGCPVRPLVYTNAHQPESSDNPLHTEFYLAILSTVF